MGVEEAASPRADWLPRPALSKRFIRVGASGRPARSPARPEQRPALSAPRRGPPGPAPAQRRLRSGPRAPQRGKKREGGERPSERAERHAPRQPRLHQVPAWPRGDGQRRLQRPARGPPARPAAARAAHPAPARRRLPIHVRGPPGTGAGPGRLQRRPVPLLPSAGECSPPRRARAGRTHLASPSRAGGKRSPDGGARQLWLIQQRKVTREGGSGSRAAWSGAGRAGTGPRARTGSRSARRLSSPGLVLLNFPRRDSIGRSPLVQIITLFPSFHFSLGAKN